MTDSGGGGAPRPSSPRWPPTGDPAPKIDNAGWVPPRPDGLAASCRFLVNCDYDHRDERGVWGLRVGYYDNDEAHVQRVAFDDDAHEARAAELGDQVRGAYYLLSSGSYFSD